MALEEVVALDVSEGLRQIDALEEALTTAAQSFKAALVDALDVLQAVQVADVDASAVTASIDSAVEAANLDPEVQADAAGVTVAIDDAVEASDTQVQVDALTAAITDDINAAIADADATVIVEADTSQAQDAIDNLAPSVRQVGDALDDAGGGLGGFAANAGLAASTIDLAAGKADALTSGLASFGAEATATVAIVGALAFATKTFVDQAIEAETATHRFETTFGELADQVDTIDVAGLNTDISSLALALGADDDQLRNVAASLGQMGIAAGKTREEVAGTAQEVILLAARASVLNPTLGTADEIASRLGGALARGGRFAAQFGISLTSAEIQARALSDTNKTNAADLTQYEKAAAGAALATERLGDTLGEDIVKGSDQPIIKLRALKQSLLETFEGVGAPLIQPVLDIFDELEPALQDLAVAAGPVLSVALEVLAIALRAVRPLFQALGVVGAFVADNMEQVQRVINDLFAPVKLVGNVLGFLGDKVGITDAHAELFTNTIDDLAKSVDDAADPTQAYGDIMDDTQAAIEASSGSAEDLTRVFEAQTDALEAADAALNQLLDDQIAYLDSTVAAEQASRAFTQAVVDEQTKFQALRDAVREHGAQSAEAAQAERDYQEALAGAKDAALQSAEAELRLAQDRATAENRTLTSTERQNIFRDSLVKLANQASGPTRDAILDLIAKLDEAGRNRTATLDVNTQPAETKLTTLRRNIESLYTLLRNPPTQSGAAGITSLLTPPGAMAGGSFSGGASGQIIEVGERGRELVFIEPHVNATVVPGGKAKGMFNSAASESAFIAAMNRLGTTPRGGGGVTIGELNVNEVSSDPRANAAAVASALGEEARR